MAKNMQPIAKRCRALGMSPAAMGYAKKNDQPQPRAARCGRRRASMPFS